MSPQGSSGGSVPSDVVAAAASRKAQQQNRTPSQEAWWRTTPFRGMANDVRRRLPHYGSDWLDAWDYRVIPATVYMYFANILPALAFSLDMFNKTGSSYGVNEVLLASVLGSVVFSLFACQPLVIVGVTGPITVFNYTVYNMMKHTGVNYLGFMGWIGIWALILHWILAGLNSCNWLRWVTRFPCDIFGFYVALIYLQKGVEVLARLGNGAPFYLSVVAALLVFMCAHTAGRVGAGSLFGHRLRVFLTDYGTPLTLVFFTGFVRIGRMDQVSLAVLPTGIAFEPTADRPWLVPFWRLSTAEVFTALPFAILLTILFWFDHNVSSLIAQGTEFPLRKPAGFHWDLFLLGATTGAAGILGLPFPNGLIPQAPFHTASLCISRPVIREGGGDEEDGGHRRRPPPQTETVRVVEQRVSNLGQGLLTLGTMTGPLLAVLHLIPHGVLAGLFFVMGMQALEGNGITAKLAFLATKEAAREGPLCRVRRRGAVEAFVLVELVGFAATFAVTQTVAAVGFPVFIMALIPIRTLLLPRWFRPEELALLDAPTASAATMEGIGGSGWLEGQRALTSSSARDGESGRGDPDKAAAMGPSPPGGEEDAGSVLRQRAGLRVPSAAAGEMEKSGEDSRGDETAVSEGRLGEKAA